MLDAAKLDGVLALVRVITAALGAWPANATIGLVDAVAQTSLFGFDFVEQRLAPSWLRRSNAREGGLAQAQWQGAKVLAIQRHRIRHEIEIDGNMQLC